MSSLRKLRLWLMSGVCGSLLLQSGSCSFDTQQFVTSSLDEIASSSSAILVTTVLAEWLKVVPSFSF